MDRELKKALECSFKLLKVKDRSKKEIIEKLKSKNFRLPIILETIKRLEDLLYIDDLKFAKNYFEKEIKKFKSINIILEELKQKYKISQEILDKLDLRYFKELQNKYIKEVFYKKFYDKDITKIYRFFQLRGFNETDIERIIFDFNQNKK
ncbi:MAG: RecX family transcriptional regulator [Endomicrobia bacterium]|nr:RecX family transcriptional regulator [Endomicrobiia bacterium]